MDTVARVRRICLALPEATERLSHGAPTFFVRERKSFTKYVVGSYGEPGPTLWCPAAPGVQDELVDAEPERFFVPPYVGPSGWIGLRLDVDPDWAEIAETVRQSYRLVAPKKLAALLDA
ncbi:MmcQ/YjbR family DNA-binding protein [Nocardia harenae]|uniref:MmcQ/YjbR family DNA-binding protein n=1 Tax=Nocardia harenae TaxID=358707 RepID=UPI0008361E0B|nr:MmcQ/YjbR family DNA-binding protein [Nocardia harenae]